MSNYNPQPPRVWSRVQSRCTYTEPGASYTYSFVPLTNQTVSQAQANYEMQQFYKGNILQYKGNSAQLTKKQRYAQLAKGSGPNRTKVFATQTDTYTNPNTTGLIRIGYTSYPFPNQIVGAPNNVSGPFLYNVSNPNDCPDNTVLDGGTLVCGTYADPCTGEIVVEANTDATVCHPAAASNVPGATLLCWNKKIQTWFPRGRYVMNNSLSKWPQGYKGLVSAVDLVAPILSYTLQGIMIVLAWKFPNNECLPISSFRLYQNGVLLDILSYNQMQYSIDATSLSGTNTFYVTSVSTPVRESPPSNTVTITVTSTVYSYTTPDTYTLQTLSTQQFYSAMIGGAGGGGGGAGLVGPSGGMNVGCLAGSGGGAGGISYLTNVTLSQQATTTLTFTVGAGGAGGLPQQYDYNTNTYIAGTPGSSGTSTTFQDSVNGWNVTCTGGTGGQYNGTLFTYGDSNVYPVVNVGGAGGLASGGTTNLPGGSGGNSGQIFSTPTIGLELTNASIVSSPGGGGGGGNLVISGNIYSGSNGASGGIGQSTSIGNSGSGGAGTNGNPFGTPANGGSGVLGSGGGGGGVGHFNTAYTSGGGHGGNGFVYIILYSVF